MKNKLQKKDIEFLLALAGFSFLCVIRYYNENIMSHLYAFSLMGNRRIIQGVTGVFFLILVGMAAVALMNTQEKEKTGIYYLMTLICIFMMPTFICDSYMGSPELYAWIVILLILLAFIGGRYEWLSLLGMLLATYLSPMIVFSGGAMLFLLTLEKGMREKKRSWGVMAAGQILVALIALFFVMATGKFSPDVQGRISGMRFVGIMILFLPYAYAGMKFVVKYIKVKKDVTHRMACILSVLGGIPGLLVWAYLGDYCRSVIYTFVYYLLFVLVAYCRDKEFCVSWNDFRDWIRERIILEPVAVIYPLIILTFWMISNDYIDAETIIEFTR